MKKYIITLLIAVFLCASLFIASDSLNGAKPVSARLPDKIENYYKDIAISLLIPELNGAVSGYYNEELMINPGDVKIVSASRDKEHPNLIKASVTVKPYSAAGSKGTDQLDLNISDDGNVEVLYYKHLVTP
jgi:hypothetical protein